MCRVGTIHMIAPGCNHVRQSGWQDSAVVTYLSFLIWPCEKCNPNRPFCSKFVIDSSLDDPGQTAPFSDPTGAVTNIPNALAGKCKFCSSYDSDIRHADRIKQTLTRYNMALLSDVAKAEVGVEMEGAFQRAVDEAVLAYGVDGKKGDKALRVLDAEYRNVSDRIGRLCGEKQLAPYQDWYRAPGYGVGGDNSSQGSSAGPSEKSRRKYKNIDQAR
ncbi:hypothetical protein F4677DRAFT_401937 [Hypoxylon crocopeplum]|nr:hypothetical protein F4677DRAFT_401937 [Hypoxylon crocopeplum]